MRGHVGARPVQGSLWIARPPDSGRSATRRRGPCRHGSEKAKRPGFPGRSAAVGPLATLLSNGPCQEESVGRSPFAAGRYSTLISTRFGSAWSALPSSMRSTPLSMRAETLARSISSLRRQRFSKLP